MDIKIGADGEKNCHVTISGDVDKGLSLPVSILFFKDLRGSPRGLRLDAIQFAVQEKMGFNLFWLLESEAKIPKLKLILPVESRGFFDFEKIKPIESPPEAIGVGLTAFRVSEPGMTFMIMLDFTKL